MTYLSTGFAASAGRPQEFPSDSLVIPSFHRRPGETAGEPAAALRICGPHRHSHCTPTAQPQERAGGVPRGRARSPPTIRPSTDRAVSPAAAPGPQRGGDHRLRARQGPTGSEGHPTEAGTDRDQLVARECVRDWSEASPRGRGVDLSDKSTSPTATGPSSQVMDGLRRISTSGPTGCTRCETARTPRGKSSPCTANWACFVGTCRVRPGPSHLVAYSKPSDAEWVAGSG